MMKSITDLDLELASGFYPVLVDYAKRVEILSYNDLKQATASRFPSLANEIERCTDQAVGRRLEVIRLFTMEKGYPDLTSLVVRRGTDRCGDGFEGDYEQERLKIAAHDWSTAEEFSARIRSIAKAIQRKSAPRRKRDEARALMADHAREIGYSKLVSAQEREKIIALIQDNSDPAEAFAQVLDIASNI